MKKTEYPQLQHCACAALRRCSRIISQYYEDQLRKAGITVAQFNTLAILANAGPQQVSQLAELLGQERTGLSRNLKIMEKNQWVNLSQGEDKRFKIIGLTTTGQHKLDACIPLWKTAQNGVEAKLGDISEIHHLVNRIKKLER